MRVTGIALVLVWASMLGCLQSSVTYCAEGIVCPAGQLCSRFGCLLPSQQEACTGVAEGGACTLPSNATGQCVEGYCVAVGCGNGRLELDEACDDGNTLGGDGCSARCDSNEVCGNAFLDTAKSEGCDCGSADFTGIRPPGCNGQANSDAPNTVCTSDCRIRGCGDGVVGGLEDCDDQALPLTSCSQVGFYTGTLSCLPSCRYDVSACSGRCNDDVRNGPPGGPDELCDGLDLGGLDCTDFGYYNANGLACNDLCGLDTTACTGFCGDMAANGLEQCDGSVPSGTDCTDFGYYTAAGLACSSACTFDTSACTQKCGDGLVNGAGEQCDTTVPAGTDCTDFGFYAAAGLACSGACTFDTAGCTQRCGDQMINGTEQCDGSVPSGTDCTDFGFYTIAGLTCNSSCALDTSACTLRCGDGALNGTEQCDGSIPVGTDCTDFGFYAAPGLACSGGCTFDTAGCTQRCGDLAINGTEQCDGSVPAGTDCTDFGFYTIAGLTCNSSCALDTSACTQRCGDGARNGAEQCDGSVPVGTDCTDFGFYAAAGLTCSGGCTFDTAGCTQRCGDLAINGTEQCDGSVPTGTDCTDFGYYAAAGLTCNSSCAFSTAGCTQRCGDGALNGTEQCDGSVPAGTDCMDFGFYAAAGLTCSGGCTFDTAGCMQRCGDLAINGSEQCDGSVPAGTDCTDFGFYAAAGLTCNPLCAFDTSACAQRCGDGSVNGPDEQCDTTVPAGVDCTDFGFYVAAGLGCSNGCTFDIGDCSQRCGDLAINGSEQCDGSVPVGTDCTDFGFYAAAGLTCNGACGFSTAGCREYCGDDLVNGTETCDGSPSAALGCAFSGDGDAGQLGCGNGCAETFDHCRSIGYEVVHSGVAATSFYDAWNKGNVSFAVGGFGRVVRSDGGPWSLVASLGPTFRGVWGSSATDVFAVGDPFMGTYGIFHYDGVSWTRMTAPATANLLWDVAGSGPNDVWAVGDGGTVLRYQGTWTVQTTPIPSSVYATGVWVDGTTVWVVGRDFFAGYIYRYQPGVGWQGFVTGTGPPFHYVFGVSANEIYAVGDSDVWRFNGVSWSSMGGCPGTQQQAIGGLIGGPVVLAGQSTVDGRGRICQLAGGRWNPVELQATPPLFGVGVGDTRLQVGGTDVLLDSIAVSWLPRTAAALSNVSGIWGNDANNVYAVRSTPNETVYRWDGLNWTAQPTPNGVFGLNDISGGTGWAVAVGTGGRILASNAGGGAWVSEPSNTTNPLTNVWGDATGSVVYAVGDAGTITRRSGGTWTVQPSGTSASLRGVWGSGTTIFAVGSGGAIVRKEDAGAFTPMTSPTAADLNDVWGRSATDVYAVGVGGGFHFNGTTWTSIPSQAALSGVWGASGDVFAYNSSQLYQFVGGRMLPVRSQIPAFLITDISGTSDLTWFAGRDAAPYEVMKLAGRLFRTTPATETNCADFWDDDHDGLADCADPECASTLACTNGGGCQPVATLACNTSVMGTTIGGATRWPAYGAGCVTGRSETGPEAFYYVRSPTGGLFQLMLSGYGTNNLDLIVSAMSPSGACLPEQSCLASSQTDGVNEAANFIGAPNTDYVVIVDGRGGAQSNFTIQVSCP